MARQLAIHRVSGIWRTDFVQDSQKQRKERKLNSSLSVIPKLLQEEADE